MPEYPERTIDPGKATGKLYHLRLRVEDTIFVIDNYQEEEFNPSINVVVFYVFNDLRSEVTVRFVDIGEIVKHHY